MAKKNSGNSVNSVKKKPPVNLPKKCAVPEAGAPRIPKKVRALKEIAKLIRERFHIPCDKQKINNWQNRRTPPFPSPGENNEYIVADCFEWVAANVALAKVQSFKFQDSSSEKDQSRLTSAATSELTVEEFAALEREAEVKRLRTRIIEEEDARFDLEQKRGKYVDRISANHTIRSALRGFHNFVKAELEIITPAQRREKLKLVLRDAGCVPEMIERVAGLFFEADQQAARELVDRIEKRCEAESKEG